MNNESLKWYLKSAEAGKIDAELFYKIGICYDDPDNQEEAFKWYLKSAEAGKVDSTLFYKLALGFEKSGNKETAIDWYIKSVKFGNSDVDVFYKIGTWYDEAGKQNEALSWYVRSAKKGKNDGNLFFKIAVICKNKGDEKGAVAWFEKSAKAGNAEAENIVTSYLRKTRKSLVVKVMITIIAVCFVGICINELVKAVSDKKTDDKEKSNLIDITEILAKEAEESAEKAKKYEVKEENPIKKPAEKPKSEQKKTKNQWEKEHSFTENLYWTSPKKRMTWKQAERYCKQHKEHGLTKWHLPSGRDLLELQKTKTSRKNDDVYWSNYQVNTLAQIVDFVSGKTEFRNQGKVAKFYCVHSK